MDYEVYRKKIEKFLSPEEVCWVIKDSFTHGELASFVERIGIFYQGVRTISIPHNQLAWDLMEEAMEKREVFKSLVKRLNSINSPLIERVRSLSIEKLKRDSSLLLEEEGGRVIWALIVDEREAVNQLVPQFIKEMEELEAMAKEEDMTSEIMESAFTEMVDKWTKKKVEKLKKVNERLNKSNKLLTKENRKLKQNLAKYSKRVKMLEKMYADLTYQKGKLNKELHKKEEEIKRLEGEIKIMRDKLKSQPVELLQKSLHQLERENKKLSYQLEKERKEREESLQRLEAEKISLKKQLETQLQKVEELNEQFHKAEERIVQLQLYLEKEKEKEKSKGGPSVIPHKGRRVGIFIDVQNVYYSAKRHFGKKIDYSKLLWFLVGNRYLVKAICYIVQHPELNQESFINLLKRNGYIVRTRGLILRADGSAKGNWDIGIATDVLYLVEKNNLDIVVLVTCDGDFVDLVKVLKSKGIKTEVVGFSKNTAVDLKRVSDEFIEIEESLMLEN